jgi:hypothetical protein
MSTKRINALSLFLGILMLLFGFLKFFQPFHGMFDVQVQQSHLPHSAVLAGKIGEMVTGFLFLLPSLRSSFSEKYRKPILLLASLMIVVQMLVAIYVHLQPGVPASVLPLGFKPPVIPIVVLLLGLVTGFAAWKERGHDTSVSRA